MCLPALTCAVSLVVESAVLHDLQECYSLTSSLLENDPYATEAYPVHITASLELRKKNELFRRAHKYATPTSAYDWSCITVVRIDSVAFQRGQRCYGKLCFVS